MHASRLTIFLHTAARRVVQSSRVQHRAAAVGTHQIRLLSTSDTPGLFDAHGNRISSERTGKQTKKGKLITDFSVDRSGLLGMTPERAVTGPAAEKEPLSPLAGELQELIQLRGPMTIAEFMMQCANHSRHGYYHSKDKDKIGQKGDFVTSPEISQVFGECVGVWCMSVWEILGSPPDFTLVELGAGNGTLLKDVLKVAANFPDFNNSLKRVAVVERSQDLRETQCRTLSGTEKVFKDSELMSALTFQKSIARPVHWYNLVDDLPDTHPIILVAQEFLDAFPVHQLVRTKEGDWREKVVALADSTSPLHFQTMLAPLATPAVKVFEGDAFQNVFGHRYTPSGAPPTDTGLKQDIDADTPPGGSEDVLTITDVTDVRDQTSIGEGIAETSSRLHELMRSREAFLSPEQQWMIPQEKEPALDEVEMCPGGLATVQAVSRKLAPDKCTGAALFIDYGENFTQADTLRGYRAHEQRHFLSEPGLTDVTADVDFYAAARAAVQGDLVDHVSVVGPVTQASFLIHMGAVERVEQLIDLDETSEEKAEEIYNAFEYLVDRSHMGEKFKALALVSNCPSYARLVGESATPAGALEARGV